MAHQRSFRAARHDLEHELYKQLVKDSWSGMSREVHLKGPGQKSFRSLITLSDSELRKAARHEIEATAQTYVAKFEREEVQQLKRKNGEAL